MRAFAVLFVAAPLFAITGCPVYGDSCRHEHDCAEGYTCNYGDCVPEGSYNPSGGRCLEPGDCPSDATCDRFGRCVYLDCSEVGCVSGYRCTTVSGRPECVANGSAQGGAGGESGAAGESGSGS